MKKMIIGVTAAIMLAGASLYATNKINNNPQSKASGCCCSDCSCPDCTCDTSCASCCENCSDNACCGDSCSK